MANPLSSDKLLAYAIATAAGSLACVSCWAWRALSSRSVRRPYASACVHSSLGAVVGLGFTAAAEVAWECNLPGKVLLSILAGGIVGTWGPDVLIRMVVTELILHADARAKRARSEIDVGNNTARRSEGEAANPEDWRRSSGE